MAAPIISIVENLVEAATVIIVSDTLAISLLVNPDLTAKSVNAVSNSITDVTANSNADLTVPITAIAAP